jgi:hypothetical protein
MSAITTAYQTGDGNLSSTGGVEVGVAGGYVGMYGVTPVVKAAVIAAPTDLATSIVAINAIRVALTNLGVTA